MWKRMKEHLDDELPWTFGGDYNFNEDSMDKLGGAFKAHTTVSLEWQELRDRAFEIVDPWVTNLAQRMHPSLEYSWTNGCKNPTRFRARRLDRIYITGSWMHKVISYGIATATVKSDHSPVVLELNLSEQEVQGHKPGMGIWRLNLDLLEAEGMKEKIKGLLAQQEQEAGKNGLYKLLKALADTQREFKRKGIQLAQERGAQERSAQQTVEALQLLVESGQELTEPLLQELDQAKFTLAMLENKKAVN